MAHALMVGSSISKTATTSTPEGKIAVELCLRICIYTDITEKGLVASNLIM